MAQSDSVRSQIAVLETQHKNMSKEFSEMKESIVRLEDNFLSLSLGMTKLVATGQVVKWMLAAAIPVVPVMAALAHRLLDTVA